MAIVDLALVRLVAIGNAGDLDVANVADMLPQRDGKVSVNDLGMVEVHLYFQVGCIHLFPDGVGFGLGIEEIAGDVAAVDGLDEQLDAVCGQRRGSVAQIGDIDGPMPAALGARRQQAGHGVEAPCAERFGAFEGADDAGAELVLATGQGGQTPFAGCPVAGRQVEEDVVEAGLFQPAGDVGHRMVVGKEELDGLEARLRSRGEALRKRNFIEHHGEVGGKFWHGIPQKLRLKVVRSSSICASSRGLIEVLRSSRKSLAVSSSSSMA